MRFFFKIEKKNFLQEKHTHTFMNIIGTENHIDRCIQQKLKKIYIYLFELRVGIFKNDIILKINRTIL